MLNITSYRVGPQLCPPLCDPVDYSLQGPLSIEFFQQEYGNGLPFPVPRDLPYPGIERGRWIPYHCATWEANY